MPAHYDDPSFSYTQYWQGRQYEHESEVLAIQTLFSRLHFNSLADVGGGYGRLIPTLSQYSSQLSLIEPSKKQRQIATKILNSLPGITVLAGTAENTRLPAASQDAVVLVRVIHHLPYPGPAFLEAARILRPGGYLLLEFANSANFKARLVNLVSGRPIPPLPLEKRSSQNIRARSIPFVNHHPQAIQALLTRHGFIQLRRLSVSNFRHPLLKKIFSSKILLVLESLSQSWLSSLWFGPSIFILARRLDNQRTL